MGCCCQLVRSSENLSHLDGKPADLATFRQAWSNECPYVVITANVLCSVAVLCNCILVLLLGIRFWWLVQGGDVCWLQRLQLFAEPPAVNSTVRLGIVKPHSTPFRLGFAFPRWCGFACLTFPMTTACMRQTGEHCISGSPKTGNDLGTTVKIRFQIIIIAH